MNKASKTSPSLRRSRPATVTPWPSRPQTFRSRPHAGSPAVAAELAERNRALEEEIAALRREHSELHSSLFGAAQVQRKLCAPRQLRRGVFEIASEIFPVRYLSGDFYAVLDLGAATGLAVGDIAGKGLAAGLWFAHLVGLIRVQAGSRPDPAAAVAAINRDLCQLQPEAPTASLFLGRLDEKRSELVYCNAGHPPPLLLRREGTVEALDEGGLLLGALPRASFACGRVTLRPGDTLIGYSDGIGECSNAREEEFGVERLLAAARAGDGSSASSLLFSILGAVQDFAGSHPREDDITLIVVRRLGEEPAQR